MTRRDDGWYREVILKTNKQSERDEMTGGVVSWYIWTFPTISVPLSLLFPLCFSLGDQHNYVCIRVMRKSPVRREKRRAEEGSFQEHSGISKWAVNTRNIGKSVSQHSGRHAWLGSITQKLQVRWRVFFFSTGNPPFVLFVFLLLVGEGTWSVIWSVVDMKEVTFSPDVDYGEAVIMLWRFLFVPKV